MRLQRLEISGFKSFPDRADLHFDSGVTAIVGPNGCGKSNLVDAITWVLGEQSARSLRGDRMEDVIFCGSDARRPTAAAEVKLRLTGVAAARVNGDLAEEPELPADGNGTHLVRDVEVSRRLYRSGESEYLIDGHVVRLRDVQDLLMDAGVGVKAYAVIEQGKIGQILGARPADRRQLIEEAAGVTKYKSRRRVAELKLEAAQQNLTRVDDVVFELEKQRGALKRQAAKARRYRRLREELRHWEKVAFARRYRALDDTLARARERLASAQEHEAALAAAVAAAEASVERVRLELAEAESAATASRERAHQQELESERRQQQLEFDRLQLEQLGSSVVSLGDEVAKLETRLAPAAAELDERREASVRADRERDAAAERVVAEEADTAAAQQQIAGLEADLDAARHEVYAGLQSIATLKHAIDRTREQEERVARDLTRLDVEATDLDAERARADAEQAGASAALGQAQDALQSVRAARAACEAELAAAREARESAEREARAKDTEIAALGARLRSLEELEAARAAFGDAARLILSEPHPDVAHAGAVADYVEADPPWEVAVEASLGDLLQSVIVERREDVTAALGLLQARRAGRCGFLVAGESVGAMRSTGPVDGAWPLSNAIRIAGRHRAAIERAIDGVLVADSLARALAVSREVDVPVVTPAGELVRAGCLVSGGGSAGTSGILSTRRAIKELRVRLPQEQAFVAALGETIEASVARVRALEADLAAHASEAHAREKEIVSLESRLSRATDEAERVARRRELVASERRRAEEEREQLRVRREETDRAIANLGSQQELLAGVLAERQERLQAARDDLTTLVERSAVARAEHATLVERSAGLVQTIVALEEALGELTTRITDGRDEIVRTRQKQRDLDQSTRESRLQLDRDLIAFEELRRAVVEAEERVSTLQVAFSAEEQAARGARRDLEGARSAVGRLEVERATAESDMTHLRAACEEALGLALETVAREMESAPAESAAPPEDVRPDETEGEDESAEGEPALSSAAEPIDATPDARVAALKARIVALGPVNMIAIEQFEELEQRHTFLIDQRRDLVDAIAATGEAIKRIDKTTRERFEDAFAAINASFDETFQTLFGGGRAGLVLIDAENTLESGIDIVAQPPGKRLQSVQLLSGGEKALTAMALMFGIFKYRPSPFCLLDEIDAPLDDANVARFIDMLRGMQTQTQFVLVTHHRRTMEIADRLYGVTMEEPGVSKLISISLN